MEEKDPNVGEDFFKKLKLKKTDLEEKLQSLDKLGFQIEEWAGKYKIFTLRQDNPRQNKHWYCITIFNGPEPKDILVQTKIIQNKKMRIKNYAFKKTIRTHYSTLAYLKNLARLKK